MSSINYEWIIAIIGAVVGSVLTIICTIVWDNHKNKNRFIALLKMLLFELKENQTRLKDTIENLPSGIKKKFKQGSIDNSFLTDEEINKLGWIFPKPYSIEAWRTFVSSGLVINLPNEVLQKLYKVYDQIISINFLSNLSVSLFQILAQENRLDPETNKNFDRFCRIGIRSIEFILLEDIRQVVQEIDRIIEIKSSPIPEAILRMYRRIFR